MPKDWRAKINAFISSVCKSGFTKLPSRNKSSCDVPIDHPNFFTVVQHAKKHKLWHYHVGIREYAVKIDYGDWLSEYVIHYKKENDQLIVICTCDKQLPMRLPKDYQIVTLH